MLRHTFSGLLASLLAVASVGPARADQVELTNGDRWSGRLLRVDRQTAWFEIDPGGIGQPQEVAVPRDRLLALKVTDLVTARMLSGERVIGTLGSVTSEGVAVDSAALGAVTLPWERVAEVLGGGAPVAASMTGGVSAAKLEGMAPLLAGLPEGELLDEQELAAFRGAGKPSGTGASTGAGGSDAELATSDTEVATKMKEEDIRQVFLRESAVLLRPGQWESEVSFRYTRLQNSTIKSYVGGGVISSERRIFESQIVFRTSPVRDVEIFVNVPVRYASQRVERVEQGGVVKYQGSGWGVGDATAGVKYHLVHEGPATPDIILSVNGTAPTGDDPYDFSPSAVTFGGGHWGVGAGVTAIKSFDPAVVFIGVDYAYRFPGDFLGGTVSPGGVIGYNLGTGFALNDKLSLSGQLSGTVQAGNGTAPGGIDVRQREQLMLRLAFTYQASQKCYLEPSISMGLTDDSPDSIVGLSISNRF